jgi:hypothetical protein
MVTEDPYAEALLDNSTSLIYGVRQSMDDYLLSCFGSMENAERYGHLYILEQTPYEFETKIGENNTMAISARMIYRLRLKTKEELRNSR